jgi:PEP-CTERM/exosortase A-associated glycosyltransferase
VPRTKTRNGLFVKILHVLDHSIPLHSGYSFRTLYILREQRRLGWVTAQLTSPKQGNTEGDLEQIEGLQFHRTPCRQDASLLAQMVATARRLDELVLEVQPSLIHAHSPVLVALPSLWVGARRGLPVVYEMRASWEDAAISHGTTTGRSPRYRVSRAVESLALRRADHVTTICEGLRQDIARRGVPSERITVIPNAVDSTAFRLGTEGDSLLSSRLGLAGRIVVGFVGSFYAYEGLHLLVAAMGRLLSRHPDIRLLLVGGGPEEGALRRQTKQSGFDEKILFTGRIPHHEVQRYYDLIDVLAYPRVSIRLTELVTPLKPLEAMAQGRLFVASDVGGHRELVRNGETGILFQAGNVDALAQAIAGLLDNRSGWDEMRARARAFVERERTWAASVARYREVYHRAIEARKART